MGIFAKPKRSHHAKPKPPVPDEKTRFINNFFPKLPPPPRVGRPAVLPPKKRGRPPAESSKTQRPAASSSPPPATSEPGAASSSSSILGKRAAATLVGTKLKRTNWSTGEHLERLTKAVENWDAKTGEFLTQDPTLSLIKYAELAGISYQTLAAYACKDVGKRKALGKSVGKKPLFGAAEQQFSVDVIRRHDRGNDGLDKRACVDVLHDLRPELSRKSVAEAFDRTVRPHHRDALTGIRKANPTTVKRTAITVAQQYRWHSVRRGMRL